MDFIGFTLIDLDLAWVITKFSALVHGKSKRPTGYYRIIATGYYNKNNTL